MQIKRTRIILTLWGCISAILSKSCYGHDVIDIVNSLAYLLPKIINFAFAFDCEATVPSMPQQTCCIILTIMTAAVIKIEVDKPRFD